MSIPLSSLSPSKQNSRVSPIKTEHHKSSYEYDSYLLQTATTMTSANLARPSSSEDDEFHDSMSDAPGSPFPTVPFHRSSSPKKTISPTKDKSLDFDGGKSMSPLGSPKESTIRFNEGLTRAIGEMREIMVEDSLICHDIRDDGMDTLDDLSTVEGQLNPDLNDETDITLNIDDRTIHDDTMGDLSTISAIPTDSTRFVNLRNSPTKTIRHEPWSPSKQLRTSVILDTPGTLHRPYQSQSSRPLHLLGSRNSNSSNEDEEATPRRPEKFNDSPTDLLNFTGQSNIFIPPPTAPRTTRRSPSGRGAFPIKVNPSPTHRSQASVDRERSACGPSPHTQRGYFDGLVPATPAERRNGYPSNGLGLDLLDIDLEPMATPRSIPTVTPRELETLRSEMQSRISGLEATLSGKEAEVMALKRSITDAEVRVGKTSEELRNERAAKEDLEREKAELERRSRDMESVLREVKQNAFVEEREREKMRREVEISERKVEECEVKILELNASLETLRSERLKSPQKLADSNSPGTPGMNLDIDSAVKQATESVARELHTLYKGKHERKVADLKVSYEKRWQKQVDQLKNDLKSAQDEILKLHTERDATISGIIPGQAEREKEIQEMEELISKNETSQADNKALQDQVEGLEEQIGTLKNETDGLRREIEQERIEKGELVAQVDLFLTMSAQQDETRTRNTSFSSDTPQRASDVSAAEPVQAPAESPSKFRLSMNGSNGLPPGSRPRPLSMLKAPNAGKFSSAIPGPGTGLKGPSSNLGRGIGMPRSGGAGIMENIARMGAGGR